MIIPENKSRNLYDFILDKNNNSTILATFFANNNFGQRSTKGFGSFSVESISDDKGINIHFGKISDFLPIGTPILRFTIHNSDKSEQVKTMFEVIDYYWKCLKSGVNYTKRKVRSDEKVDIVHKERYIKSFLYIYLQSTNYTWEKRCVKQTFNLETKCPERYIEKNTREPMFARALLGLQEHMEYRVPQGKLICRDNNKEFIKRNDVAITSINKSIDRIASPIIFKPCIVDDEIRVYILFDTELIEKLQQLSVEQCSFDFECKGKHLQLSLKPNVVDYKDLIKKFHAYINNNKQVFSNGLESWSFIPRNFKWDNILGKNGNRDNLVYLRQKS